MKNIIKRTALICLSVIMTFAVCVNSYAYVSGIADSDVYSGYGTYVEVNTGSNPYATAHITSAGKTLDLIAYIFATVEYPEPEDTTRFYVDEVSETKTLGDENVLDLPVGYIKRITEVSTDEVLIDDGGTLLHTYGCSDAYLSDYQIDEDGEYIYEYIYAETASRDSVHNSNVCTICQYWGYLG